MDNRLEQVAMKIILKAGDARENIKAAINCLSQNDKLGYEKEMTFRYCIISGLPR